MPATEPPPRGSLLITKKEEKVYKMILSLSYLATLITFRYCAATAARRRAVLTIHNQNKVIHFFFKSTPDCLALSGLPGPLFYPCFRCIAKRWQKCSPQKPLHFSGIYVTPSPPPLRHTLDASRMRESLSLTKDFGRARVSDNERSLCDDFSSHQNCNATRIGCMHQAPPPSLPHP